MNSNTPSRSVPRAAAIANLVAGEGLVEGGRRPDRRPRPRQPTVTELMGADRPSGRGHVASSISVLLLFGQLGIQREAEALLKERI